LTGPTTTELIRTAGAHSTASDCVSESTPALAAPYDAVPGDGRCPETDEMLMIAPPVGCMTRLASCATVNADSRLRATILAWKLALASAARANGAPPALFTTTSSRPWSATMRSTIARTASASRRSTEWNSRSATSEPSSAGRRAQVTTTAPASRKTLLMPAPTPRTPPVTRTTFPARPRSMFVMRASLPSKRLVSHCAVPDGGGVGRSSMGINVDKGADGIATVTVDYPPVNAIPSAGWFELGEQILAAGRDPDVHVVILRAEG